MSINIGPSGHPNYEEPEESSEAEGSPSSPSTEHAGSSQLPVVPSQHAAISVGVASASPAEKLASAKALIDDGIPAYKAIKRLKITDPAHRRHVEQHEKNRLLAAEPDSFRKAKADVAKGMPSYEAIREHRIQSQANRDYLQQHEIPRADLKTMRNAKREVRVGFTAESIAKEFKLRNHDDQKILGKVEERVEDRDLREGGDISPLRKGLINRLAPGRFLDGRLQNDGTRDPSEKMPAAKTLPQPSGESSPLRWEVTEDSEEETEDSEE